MASGSPIVFGSINQSESESIPAGSEDSTTSSGNGDIHHFRAQVPPTISQASIMPNLGVPVSVPYPQRPPIKAQTMAPINSPHHGHHHTHISQWSQPSYYMPTYDTGYYQPMYQPQIPAYGSQTRPFNMNAPSFTPKSQPSKRITIINPLTMTEVTPVPPPSDSKPHSKPVVKHAGEDTKPIFTAPTKSIIKIVNPAEKDKEERERKEKDEITRKEQEEKERLEREEQERIIRKAQEAEERRIREEQAEKERHEALVRAEQERMKKEERERKEREERERKEREEKERLEAERKRKEEEERIAREKAEAEAEAKAKAAAEAEAAEAAAAAAAAAAAEKACIENEKAELEAKERAQKLEGERHALEEKLKQEQANTQAKATASIPTPPDSAKAGLSVDLSRTSSAPAPSGASARIENFGAVSYPSHIQSPAPDGQGKFRYNRDFLMQFMTVCTDKPDSLPSLEVLGGEDHRQPPGGLRGVRGPMSNNRGKPSPMGSFKVGDRPTGMPLGMRQMSGDARLNRSPSENQFLPRNNFNNNLSRPPSQRGSRGGRRGGRGGHHGGHQDSQLTIPLADIVPLEKTENAWTPNVNASQAPATISADEPLSQEQVARKVKGLLNKLTLEKFDSISDKIIDIANLSAREDDGTTLKHCIQIIFEKATDEPNFGSVYARLCQKLMEEVSDEVKDKTVQGSAGGKLFRKYLLHRCQEEFVKGWKDKATNGASNDKDGPDLMSDEYYIMMKAKRQGLGLIHFIGELFKLQMLTEKIMHECVKKLLANVKDPEEEETEGLCKLMTTVGLQLDRPEAKSHLDVYFNRMTELTKNTKLASRIRFMVQDVIDLRANSWVNRRAASGPKTIAAIHEEAARQQEEKELMRHTASSGGGRGLPNRREQLSRGQSFRGSGDARHDHGGGLPVGADGWSTVTPINKKAGDLSSFGNTSRSKVSGLPSLGPGSVFGALNKSKREAKAASQSEPRSSTITSANSFSALEGGADEKPVERRRLNLLPRSTPVPENEGEAKQPERESESEAPKKTEEEAKRSIANTLKEFMSIKDMNELLISVKELDACYRSLLVTEFVNQSMEMKPSEVDSIGDVFKKLGAEKVVTEKDFEAGFSEPLELLPDTAIDVPNAFKIMAQLLEAAGMDPTKVTA
ncbi:hypothetical protein BGZ92_002164 [Podila epicladia]|nr:hypothetical protein BGZ92_002164 [Podila epicladia]